MGDRISSSFPLSGSRGFPSPACWGRWPVRAGWGEESGTPTPTSGRRGSRHLSGIDASAHTPSGASRHLPRFAEKGARLAALAALAASLAAPATAFTFPGTVKVSPACVATVNKAALQAMTRTSPLGQMQIFGDPGVFDPHLLRVTVRVFGGRTEIYSVDVAIDDACRVLSASTRLETNDWPYR